MLPPAPPPPTRTHTRAHPSAAAPLSPQAELAALQPVLESKAKATAELLTRVG